MNIQNIFVLTSFIFILSISGCGGNSSPSSGGSGGSSSGNSGGSSSGGSTSTAGSTSTMLNYQDALFVLENNQLSVINLNSNPPVIVGVPIDVPNSETLFVYDEHLYIGGTRGVTIYNINDPFNPYETSFYTHLNACDPVIVDNDIGYVTLRSVPGSLFCRARGVDRLEIVDFSDPKFPEFIAEYRITNPYGLAKTPDYLAICQEDFGLSLLDVNVPTNVSTIVQYPDIRCFDLIYYNQNLIATATNGIFQQTRVW